MADVDSVLLNVRERDKWRLRMAQLEADLRKVRDARRRLERRLVGLVREIARLRELASAARQAARPWIRGVTHEPRPPSFSR